MLRVFKENQKNPFLLFLGFTHPFQLRPSVNASKLSFPAARTRNSLTA